MNCIDLLQNGYVPYSGEPQIAAVRGRSGRLYAGVRIENISFPLTIPAVQNALFCCLSEGDKPDVLYVQEENSEIPPWAAEFDTTIRPFDTVADEEVKPVIIPAEEATQVRTELNRLHGLAHTPNSNFPVAALLETAEGWVAGVNIESREWNRGLCAERIALAKAVTYGLRDIQALHIYAKDGEYSSPCGACRQVIVEHLPHHPIVLYHSDGSVSRHFSDAMLPHSFRSSRLQQKHKNYPV